LKFLKKLESDSEEVKEFQENSEKPRETLREAQKELKRIQENSGGLRGIKGDLEDCVSLEIRSRA